jgi:hypothetical protein
MPQSYVVFSHLCASVAQESASPAPATCRAVAAEAAAQSPNAPSTWTQAPCSRAQAISGTNGSLAPLLTLPACRHTSAGPLSGGRAEGSIRPWASTGSTTARSRPRPVRPSALRTAACTSAPTTTVTGGAPARPWPAASHPCLASTASRPAARQVAFAIVAPETKPPAVPAGSASSSAAQRSATALSRAAVGDITVSAAF